MPCLHVRVDGSGRGLGWGYGKGDPSGGAQPYRGGNAASSRRALGNDHQRCFVQTLTARTDYLTACFYATLSWGMHVQFNQNVRGVVP